ncbi:MAG: hypothetical protein JW997_03795, partial [Actinobacteria bacterium]|nr:hypothetical protein [Actinomycetota bacterium]
SEIDKKYATGIIDSFKSEAKMLKSLKDGLYRAKCYQAYIISEQIKKLAKDIEDKGEDNLNDLYSDVTIYENKKIEYKNKKSQRSDLKEKCRDYEWLKKVPPVYERLSIGFVKRPKAVFAIIAGLFLIAAAIFSIFNIVAGAISAIAAAAALLYFYINRLIKSLRAADPTEEFNKLKASFKERTGRQLSDIAVLNAEIESQQSFYEKLKFLEAQISEQKKELSSLEIKIHKKFFEITGCTIPESEWLGSYSSLRNEIRDLKDEIESLHKKQLGLAVTESEYLEEDPGIKFSYEKFAEATERLEVVKLEISERNSQLSALKQVVCNETADDITIEWEQLIENLKDKKNEKQQSLLEIKSRIIAGIIVHGEISIFRQEEDIKIEEGLKSEEVLNPLKEITRKYSRLSLDGDSLIASDDYRDYPIKDLSTGAREQIMLALRLGFASRILKQDRLFLILDDALQHTDWAKREVLVKKLADIAHGGWQVIYFSMDDHIKELFEMEGKSFKKGEFVFIELGS